MRLGFLTAVLAILVVLARVVVISAGLLRHVLLRGTVTPEARSTRPQAAVDHTAPPSPQIPAARRPTAPDSGPHPSTSDGYIAPRLPQPLGNPTPHDASSDETVASFCAANWSTLVSGACGAFTDPRGPHLGPFVDEKSPCVLKRGDPVVLSAYDDGWRIWDHLLPRWRLALRQCSEPCVLAELGSFDSRSVRWGPRHTAHIVSPTVAHLSPQNALLVREVKVPLLHRRFGTDWRSALGKWRNGGGAVVTVRTEPHRPSPELAALTDVDVSFSTLSKVQVRALRTDGGTPPAVPLHPPPRAAGGKAVCSLAFARPQPPQPPPLLILPARAVDVRVRTPRPVPLPPPERSWMQLRVPAVPAGGGPTCGLTAGRWRDGRPVCQPLWRLPQS